MSERDLVFHYLGTLAARATIHANELPWWAFMRRRAAYTVAGCHAYSALAIERGEHLSLQGQSIGPVGGEQA